MKSIKIVANADLLDDVINFLDEILEENDCPIKTQMQIDIVVEEVFVNIAYYDYDGYEGMVEIKVDITDNPRTVTIIFVDDGKPYDMRNTKEPDITLSAEERKIGGLGIFMVKNSMDSVDYEYKDNQNIVTLKKRLFA